MTGTALAQLARMQGRAGPDGWRLTLIVWAVAVPEALVLEALRPAPAPDARLDFPEGDADDERVAREVADSRSRGLRWTYWETQCPGWVRWGMPALGLGFVALGVREALDGRPWLALLVLIGVSMVVSCGGGLRVSVNHDEIVVRIGYAGWRVLRLPLARVAAAEVHAFNPVRDFGGYGLRANREMRAFFLQGDRGVKLTTSDGRRYLIGSDHPSRLAAVIEAARRA